MPPLPAASPTTAVVTTIQAPTECMRRLGDRLVAAGIPLLVVGDEKGPWTYDLPGSRLLDLHQQRALPLSLAAALPTRHYARKNLGYLEAIRAGATCLYETDDDNAPLPTWAPRSQLASAHEATLDPQAPHRNWLNIYRLFSDRLIWPRGFPLDLVREPSTGTPALAATPAIAPAPIQQGLADGSPDVDAVWRLILDEDITFRPEASVRLAPGTWCPFNSQTTWWWPAAFPLLYLPSYCSFRMTDIWRGFVAQRCLWAMGYGLVFHRAEVVQLRNPHHLLRDFSAEITGYEGNQRLTDTLAALDLASDPARASDNLVLCYEALVREKFVPEQELGLVQRWVADLAAVSRQGTP